MVQVLRRQRDELELTLKEEREERRLMEFNLTSIKEEFSRLTAGVGGLNDLSGMLAECRESHEVVKKKLKDEITKNTQLKSDNDELSKNLILSKNEYASQKNKNEKLEKLYTDLSSE